jgi:hypothetical protein
MRDVHGWNVMRGAEAIEIRQDFKPMRLIDGRQWLVEQQQLRIRQEGATKRHALLFPTGQARRPPLPATTPGSEVWITSSVAIVFARSCWRPGRTADSGAP